MMRKINCALMVLVGTSMVSSAFASDQYSHSWENMAAELGLGTVSTQTKERVYYPESGNKLSQLNWRVRNSPIINGALAWQLHPQLSLDLSGWTTFTQRGGMMNDYDWENPDQQGWTSRSHHPNSQLNHGNHFDISLKYWLWSNDEARIGIVSGYQQTRYSFSAYGGSYNYNNGDYIGQLPDKLLGLTYRQTFKTPYIGTLATYRYQQWEVGGEVKYSAWARASDVDNHYLTDTIFHSTFTKQKFAALSLNGGYYLTDNAKVYLEGTWSRTFNKKGRLGYYDRAYGDRGSFNNSAGIENTSLVTNLGLRYTF